MSMMNQHISELVKVSAKWNYHSDGTKDKSTFKLPFWSKVSKDNYKSGNQFIIRTGKQFNLMVVDVDIKKGDNGLDTLFDYGIDLDDYPTLKFQTPSGGFHHFYKYNDRYDGWSKDFIPFVDMIGDQKGNGWFVFHDTERMDCINDTPIVDMPDELYEMLVEANKKYTQSKSKPLSKAIKQDVESNASTEDSDDPEVDDAGGCNSKAYKELYEKLKTTYDPEVDPEDKKDKKVPMINDKYYDLLNLLDDEWFQKYNIWIEPAYALYNQSDIQKDIAFNTWNKLLKEKAGSKYNFTDAKNVWSKTLSESQEEMKKHNRAIITMAKFKKILGGSKNAEYSIWKDKYEPKKEKLKTKSDLKDQENEQYDSLIDELAIIINSYGKTMIYDDNEVSFSDVLRLHRKTIDVNDLAMLFNQSYVNILQSGCMYLIIKEIQSYRCPNTKAFKSNILFTKVDFNKTIDKDILSNVKNGDEIVKVNIKRLIKDLSTSINNYNGVSFYPFGPKTLQNTPDSIFNIFTGFLHQYKDDFVPDDKIVDTFRNMYKEILCNNVEKSFEFEMKKLAHMIQRPEIKTEAVSIFKAGQGVGKSFLLMFLMKYVFGKHLSITIYDQKQLTNKFNSHLMGKLFCILEEGVDLGNANDISMFKGMIRAPIINIEYKGINVFDAMDCCMNFFIATNNDYNRLLGESDERTANFNICNEKYKRNTTYFGEMSAILNNYQAGEHIFHYLANMDISDFDVRNVPENEEKLRKKINASPSFIRFLYKLYKNDLDEDTSGSIPWSDVNGDSGEIFSGIESLKDEPTFMNIMKIMKDYSKVCETDFNTKPSSKTDIREKYIDKYFINENRREYKAGRWEFNINKDSVRYALNKHFDTTEF